MENMNKLIFTTEMHVNAHRFLLLAQKRFIVRQECNLAIYHKRFEGGGASLIETEKVLL